MRLLLRITLSPFYSLAIALSLAGSLYAVFYYVPVDHETGSIPNILYLHLPAAFCTFLAAGIVAASGTAYLWHRTTRWDALAGAAGYVTVLCCSIVLITGMIWGRDAWGVWWTWSASLTFSFILWVLYVVYIVLRRVIHTQDRRAMVCAVYGIIAALDVPLVYLSVQLIPDIHPRSIGLQPSMRYTLVLCTLTASLVTIGLIAIKMRKPFIEKTSSSQ